jgi:hypothetical protein
LSASRAPLAQMLRRALDQRLRRQRRFIRAGGAHHRGAESARRRLLDCVARSTAKQTDYRFWGSDERRAARHPQDHARALRAAAAAPVPRSSRYHRDGERQENVLVTKLVANSGPRVGIERDGSARAADFSQYKSTLRGTERNGPKRPPTNFELGASTNSATGACGRIIGPGGGQRSENRSLPTYQGCASRLPPVGPPIGGWDAEWQ